MTDAQKQQIIQLRSEKKPLREIAKTVNVNLQHMIRFLSAYDHEDMRVSSLVGVSKVNSETPGELDFSKYENLAEQARAAELWFGRMRGARWDTRRRPDEG